MAFDKIPKSDRFQTVTAVLFMSLFAVILLIAMVPKGNITSFVCNNVGDYDGFASMCSSPPLGSTPTASGELIASQIDSACVDAEGLKISVAFDTALVGEALIQVFSTGPDFFPSARGLTDTYEVSKTISPAVDHLDLLIPVDSMAAGELIFGNVAVSGDGASSHVTYLINVSDCSLGSAIPSNPVVTSIPSIHSATCLPNKQLMIAFAFEEPVLGQYQALVADTPYELASVVTQPSVLFFAGEPPPEGLVVVKLVSATDEVVVFEETYTPPICGAN
ncbi:MAG: hypothetical protein EHM33_29875 [Chloroflexi bacterium]|nr:MAG: hypothetical protein EHM33_29875 [Chloroflexota bacterium]